MKKIFKIISLTIILVFFSKTGSATNEENIYDKIDLFVDVLDKIN